MKRPKEILDIDKSFHYHSLFVSRFLVRQMQRKTRKEDSCFKNIFTLSRRETILTSHLVISEDFSPSHPSHFVSFYHFD